MEREKTQNNDIQEPQEKEKNEMQQVAHQDIYWSPEYEEFLCDSQQPSHKNDLLRQMQQDCNLHTHNPGKEGRTKISDSWLYDNKFWEYR